MNTVTFCFDLGDYTATYTGRIEGHTDNIVKVTYFEPMTCDLVSIDLRKDQILSRGYQEIRMLPMAPIVQEVAPRPFIAHAVNMPVYA